MRAAEWINILAFSCFAVLAWYRGLPAPRRAKVTAMGAVGLGATAIGAGILPRVLAPLPASVSRDWLPAALLLMVYWQAGQFFLRVDQDAQRKLLQLDRKIVEPLLEGCSRSASGSWFLTYLELAYLFCYPLVPLSLGAVYLLRARDHADHFWAVVLVATYACYAMVPFVQTLPPRMLAERDGAQPPSGRVRRFNLWLLRRASIQANTFPSAHVASSLACALVLLRLDLRVGLTFLLVAISIALGAVAGRYHYAADAIVGAVVALAVFLVQSRLLIQ
jgi:membrane-associated phospholipid phosphatase